uniref:MTSS I-BAR domain containing 2 n=1 Tax=Laticauda laticaudata TaxID=8630 RepID=A0A8C5WPT6_LATLA
MCMRHRSIETKLRYFTNALMESLINPLQERIEDWKKTANQLDKDHAKEYKRARHEIKKKSSDTLKLQKKARKGRGDLQPQLDNALQDVNDLYLLLEETEKQAVRRALVEERGRFCTFIAYLQPVVVIQDLKGSDYSWSYQTPPSSPSSSGSRKSSMCSSVAQPANTRLSSVSSHDSGFISQDAMFSKPPSPMPLDITSQKSSSSASSEASETCQSVSECNSPTSVTSGSASGLYSDGQKDWSKLPIYEQLGGASALQRRKDRVAEPGSASLIYPGLSLEDSPRPRLSPASIAAKHGEEVSPAASDLAMVLTHGLSLEHQKSSRDSLQFSSGYSTQNTTPSCSEDTIPSQGSEYDCYSVNGDIEGDNQNELDKSSTIPRNSNIAQNYRRMIQTKRPASTAGLPIGTALPTGTTPGVATIRRTPSTKPTVRRTISSAGPIPIRPPIIPVKTPTVPDSPSHASPLRMGSEECVFYTDDACSPHGLDFTKASPKRLSLPNASWGGNALEVSVHAGARKPSTEEEQQLAANRHSLVEKIGELVASAHALGDGQFPFPTVFSDPGPEEQTPILPLAASSNPPAEDMLVAIRRGVRLRRTITNDRSAPRFL